MTIDVVKSEDTIVYFCDVGLMEGCLSIVYRFLSYYDNGKTRRYCNVSGVWDIDTYHFIV